MSYSTSERLIANILSRFPFIKKWLKLIYQTLNFWVYKKTYKSKTDLVIKRIGNSDKETFFGYYDKSPINKTGQYLIFQETTHSSSKKPSKKYPIYVVLFDIEKDIELRRWETFAYNWQQGSKLMWIAESKFIFNTFNNKSQQYNSVIVDVNRLDSIQTIDSPIYDAIESTALSLSFERLNEIMPDYGYRNHQKSNPFNLSKNGIHLVDIKSNANKLILSLDEIIELHYKPNMDNAKHWVNHIMLSPKSDSFIFLHRWINNGKKYDALIFSDIKGEKLKCLSDHEMVSHCFWKNNNEVVAYMRTPDGDLYYLIDTISGEISAIKNSNINRIGDGHPNVYNNEKCYSIVTPIDRG